MDLELIARKTVLLVDDSPDNLVLMNDLLKDLYKVKVANSGEKALRIAATGQPPDVVLLDVMMPDMDGYEVCRRLKANPATRDIPIIFLTAKTEVEDERLGLDLGAVDYITKRSALPSRWRAYATT
jgi:putative two-component system response regulator